jgi:hypothetical protein
MADKQAVPNGAYLLCDKGVKPSQLTVTPSNVSYYGELAATEFDALPVLNVPDFGACLILKKCVPATAHWQDVVENGVTIGLGRPLKEDSVLPCAVGGTVRIFLSLAAATAAATNHAAAEEAKAEAKEAKKDAGMLFWAGVGLAAVVGVAAIALTGGAAAPLVALAAEVALDAAIGGAVVGAVAGGVAGGVDGYNSGGLEGAAEGILPGAASGALMGSAAGVVTALGGGALLLPSVAAFGYGVYEDARAMYYEPSVGSGLVLFSDAVTIGVGLKAGDAVRPKELAPAAKVTGAEAPAPEAPAPEPVLPEVFSGRRPKLPERPVLDENGNLTEYGKWYYQRPSGYHKGVRDKVWEAGTKTNAPGKSAPDGNVYDPLTEEPMDPNEPWDMGHKPKYEFRKHQKSAAERGIGTKQFTKEHNNPDHYRPETQATNRSHQGEDVTDDYFGD